MRREARPTALPGADGPETCAGDTGGLVRCRPRGEEQLLADGWQARFVADARMLKEAVENYRELGYEVKALALDPDAVSEECAECALVAAEFRALYTRRRS